MVETQPIRDETTPDNVIPLFIPAIRGGAVPRASLEELQEYRRMWPLVMQMYAEFQLLKAPTSGCPFASRMLTGSE
jgi:hypothetical protein